MPSDEAPDAGLRFRFTLAKLADALRGMSREAPILVRLPDGSLCPVRLVRPVHVRADSGEALAAGLTPPDGAVYAITLEAGER